MGLFEGFLDKMKLNDGYESDDLYNDEEDVDDEPVRAPKKSRQKAEDLFESEPLEEKIVRQAKPKTTRPVTGKVVNMQKNSRGMEVCVIKPNNVEDGREISDTLLSGRAVVLNLEGLNVDIAQRIIDFTSGACYSMNGNLQKISSYIFIITPPSVDVSGDFQELMGGDFSVSGTGNRFN